MAHRLSGLDDARRGPGRCGGSRDDLQPRSGGDLPAGLLAIALGIVLLSISIGLGLRRRWAWHVKYWGLVMALVGLALTILSSLPLFRTPQEMVGPLLLALAVGLWCGLNLRYFRRRRSLFF